MNNLLTFGWIADKTSKTVTPLEYEKNGISYLIQQSSGKEKTNAPALTMMNTGRTGFQYSNVAALDIDSQKLSESVWNKRKNFTDTLQNIVFMQQSHSGKLHIVYEIPMAYDRDKYIMESYSFIEMFDNACRALDVSDSLNVGWSKDCDIDLHSAKPEQILFVSPYQPYYNNKYTTEGMDFDSHSTLYNKYYKTRIPTTNPKNVGAFDTESAPSKKFGKFIYGEVEQANIIDGQIKIDYSFTDVLFNELKTELFKICGNIEHEKEAIHKGWFLLLRPRIEENFAHKTGIYSHKMDFYVKRDNNNNVVKWKQGEHRRLRLKVYFKQFFLNAIASINHNPDYKQYAVYDIYHSFLYAMGNWVERYGNSRDIFGDVFCEIIYDVLNNWELYDVGYSTNKYWEPHDKINTRKDLLTYMTKVKKIKFNVIDETALQTIRENGWFDFDYGLIAFHLNSWHIEAKTKKGWSRKSVSKLFESNPIAIDEIKRKEDCISDIIRRGVKEGQSYTQIADTLNGLGYKTKQGKSFNKDTIKNYYRKHKTLV